MSSPELLLGIDGGGTRTRAVLADVSGAVLARSAAGGGNFQSIGLDGLEPLLHELVSGLEPAVGDLGDRSLCLCMALAGAGRAREQQDIINRLSHNHIVGKVRAVSDARAALEGAHGGNSGLVVIAGTGSMVLGKDSGGEEARAGGWGPILGDEGSGYAVALAALQAVLQHRDGWAPPTRLEGDLAAAFELTDWDDVVAAVYGGRLDRKRIAAAVPLVLAAARSGDEVARSIVDGGARALGHQIGAVARRLGMTQVVEVAGAGGLFEQGDLLWGGILEAARDYVGTVRPRAPLLSPVMGALILARREAEGDVDWTPDPSWIEALAAAESTGPHYGSADRAQS